VRNMETDIRELDEETIRNLVKQILSNPEKYPTESKMILVIETWTRQGPSFSDFQRYRVLEGEVNEIILEERDEGYPYRFHRKFAIIPMTLPVIIEVESYDETSTPIRSSKSIYVFTTDGWKTVRIY